MEEGNLVAGLKKGEEHAYRIFMERYKTTVYSIIYSITGRSNDVDDIAQDVFISVFRKINGFRENSALSTWLYRVTVNRCKDYFRKNRRHTV